MDISKIKVVLKLIFGGVDSALEYILGKFNDLMCKPDVAERIEQAVAAGRTVLSYMGRWNDWCPPKWRQYYEAVYTSVEAIVDTFVDGKVTSQEIVQVKNAFQIAYATWISED